MFRLKCSITAFKIIFWVGIRKFYEIPQIKKKKAPNQQKPDNKTPSTVYFVLQLLGDWKNAKFLIEEEMGICGF